MRHIKIFVILALILCAAASCHTGIESTRTIRLTKSEEKELAATQEELLMSEIKAPVMTEWEKGKPFYVADARISIVFDPLDMKINADSLVGKTINYEGVALKPTPDGSQEAVIVFDYQGAKLSYSTGKPLAATETSMTSMDVPMLIDPKIVEDAKRLLTGKNVWTRSPLWYDSTENKIQGKKFVPVTIEDVAIGNIVFPLKVYIKDMEGNAAMMFMNIGNSGIESRTFQNLFTLNDPKDKYPHILPEVWETICNSKVRVGMTKEECKLALGNPKDATAGHDWNSTIDLWQYTDGTYLRFQDGLLVSFR